MVRKDANNGYAKPTKELDEIKHGYQWSEQESDEETGDVDIPDYTHAESQENNPDKSCYCDEGNIHFVNSSLFFQRG